MNLLKWDGREFLFKFLNAQGAAISALLVLKTTDPWQWANVLFIGLCVAAGVDTATWLLKSKQASDSDA